MEAMIEQLYEPLVSEGRRLLSEHPTMVALLDPRLLLLRSLSGSKAMSAFCSIARSGERSIFHRAWHFPCALHPPDAPEEEADPRDEDEKDEEPVGELKVGGEDGVTMDLNSRPRIVEERSAEPFGCWSMGRHAPEL